MAKVRRCFGIDKETAEIIMEEMENLSEEDLQAMYEYAEKINKKFEEEIRSRGGKR